MGAGDLARTGSREDVCVDLATAPSAVRPNGGAGSIVGIGGVRLTAFAEATVVPNGVRLTAFAEATAVKKPDSTEYVLHSLPHLRLVSELPRPDAAGARDVARAGRGRLRGLLGWRARAWRRGVLSGWLVEPSAHHRLAGHLLQRVQSD